MSTTLEPRPTTRMIAHTTKVSVKGYDNILLRVIDTPGLELRTDEEGSSHFAKERERGVKGLITLMEARFEDLLREETRIFRRKTGDDESVVHLSEPDLFDGLKLEP